MKIQYLWGLETCCLVCRCAGLLNRSSSVGCYCRVKHLRTSFYNRSNKAARETYGARVILLMFPKST